MMNKPMLKCHSFGSLKVYPRVHYFQTRFREVLARFQRVEGYLPKCFRKEDLFQNLCDIKRRFENGLNVEIYGDGDLQPDQFVKDVHFITPMRAGKPPGWFVHIYTKLTKLTNVHDEQELKEDIDDFLQDAATDPEVKKFLLIREHEMDLNTKNILQQILEACEDRAKNNFEHESIAMSYEKLTENISFCLEKILVQGLDQMSVFLQQFWKVSDQCFIGNEENVLYSEEVFSAVRSFLQSDYVYLDTYFINKNETSKQAQSETIKTGESDYLTPGVQRNSDAVSVTLESLARVVRCASLEPFSKKFSIPGWICNSFLFLIEFEEALIHSLTKNTRYHFAKRCECALGASPGNHSFDYLSYMLQNDMRATFETAEEKFSSFQKLTMMMKKVDFEIFGYLKQTLVIDVKTRVCGRFLAPVIETSLRKDILSISGVYGLGTIYGQLEIHIACDKIEPNKKTESSEKYPTSAVNEAERSNKEDEPSLLERKGEEIGNDHSDISTDIYKTTKKQKGINKKKTANRKPKRHKKGNRQRQEKGDNQSKSILDTQRKRFENEREMSKKHVHVANVQLLKKEIHSALRKHNFFHPYSVKLIVSEPSNAVHQVKPGDKIESPDGDVRKIGTLGGFWELRCGFFGLTCAHVIGTSEKVYAKTKTGKRILLSTSQKKYSLGKPPRQLIDIAALHILPDKVEEYRKTIKKDFTNIDVVSVSNEPPVSLLGRRVSKVGAQSGFTEGIILVVDYNRNLELLGDHAEKYLILIDHLNNVSGDFEDTFKPISRNQSSASPTEEPGVLENPDQIQESFISDTTTNAIIKLEMVLILKDEDDINPITFNEEINFELPPSGVVYVRKNLCSSDENTTEEDSSEWAFSKQGDSGSIILLEENPDSVCSKSALSVLLGGDFMIRGHVGKMSLSFTLCSGLAALNMK